MVQILINRYRYSNTTLTPFSGPPNNDRRLAENGAPETEAQVDFLDTSGSMQFPAMRRLSITTASAFLIVYAVDDETSYEVLKMSVAEIREIRPDFQVICPPKLPYIGRERV